jgi:hypothetical protein
MRLLYSQFGQVKLEEPRMDDRSLRDFLRENGTVTGKQMRDHFKKLGEKAVVRAWLLEAIPRCTVMFQENGKMFFQLKEDE